MPELPTNLESLIDQVVNASAHASSTTDEEGVTYHSYTSGNGWLPNIEAFHTVKNFQEFTPSVFWLSDGENSEACAAFDERWANIQKT